MNLRLPGFAVVLLASVVLVDAAMVLVVNLAYDSTAASDWIAFYTGGTLVRTGDGARLYDAAAQAAVQHDLFGPDAGLMGYPLPAFATVLFAPLTRLSFDASYWVWFAVNLALLGVLARACWSLLDETAEPGGRDADGRARARRVLALREALAGARAGGAPAARARRRAAPGGVRALTGARARGMSRWCADGKRAG